MKLPTPEELKQLREELGLTQSELANRADVSQPLIARIEGGDVDPRLSTLRRIVNALEEERGRVKRAEDIMNTDVVMIREDDSVAHAIEMMDEAGFSQLPVVEQSGAPTGIISNSDIREHREDGDIDAAPVADVMSESFATVGRDTTIDDIDKNLDLNDAVIVKEKGEIVGIITEADIAAHLG